MGSTADILDLEEIIKFQEPLVKVGVAVRWRFIEQAKVFWFNNDPSADEPDQFVIAAGNEAAHGGNVLADAAMFELKLLDVDQNQCHFQWLYEGDWFECLSPSEWPASILAMRNLYGTMSSYGAFNKSSSMSASLDARFSLLWTSSIRPLNNIRLAGYDEIFTFPVSRRKDLNRHLADMWEMT